MGAGRYQNLGELSIKIDKFLEMKSYPWNLARFPSPQLSARTHNAICQGFITK